MQVAHPVSGLGVRVENEGESWWAYLVDGTGEIIADVWVRNRVPAPKSLHRPDYVGRPPPAIVGFDGASPFSGSPGAGPTADWSADGRAVSVTILDLGTVVLASTSRRGWSSNLLRTGPWGQVLDETARADLQRLGLLL